jgi:hypothetical protein
MKGHEEMEGDSRSNVPILSSHGTFITVTEDGSSHSTVTGSIESTNSGYGLVSPERHKSFVWSFFKKYGSKKFKSHEKLNAETGGS